MTKEQQQPPFGEILGSDLAYNYLGYVYNTSATVNFNNPSALWEQILWDPWLAMTVFRDIEEKDDAVFSSIETRKDGVLAKARRMLPASDKRQDKKAADFINETLEGYFDQTSGDRTGLDQVLYETLDAIGMGVSIAEKVFREGSDRIYISSVNFKPQHLFSFSNGPLAAHSTPSYLGMQTGPLRLRNAFGIPGVGEDGKLSELKFMVAPYRPRYGNRWGSPLFRKVFWPSFFKRNGLKQFLRYVEKGSGSVLSRYPSGAGPDEQQKALEAALAVVDEIAAAVPTKFPIEVLQHVRQSMGSAYSQLIDDLCNNAIMRVILGQTLTGRGGEGGGGWSRGDVHQRIRSEKVEADAKFLMYVVNTALVWPLVLFNVGPVPVPPMWVIDYEPELDLSAISTWLARLWKMRVKIPTNYVYKTFSMPQPGEGEEVLEGPDKADEPDAPAAGVDSSADFSEAQKKKPALSKTSNKRSQSRMERFSKLRPSMTKFKQQS